MSDPFHPPVVLRDEGYDVMEWCGRFWQQRVQIALWGIAAAIITTMYALACTKPYVAGALLRIDSNSERQIEAATLESEMDFIRARSTFLRALDMLGPSVDVYRADSPLKSDLRQLAGMEHQNIFHATTPQFTIDTLLLPDRLLNQKLALCIEEGSHYTLRDANQTQIFSDVLGSDAAAAAEPVTLQVSDITASPGQCFTVIPRSPKDIVGDLQSQLSMETIGRRDRSGFVRLTFASENAEFAKRFLSAVMQSYVNRAYEQRASGKTEAVKKLTDQLAATKQALETAESTRESFEQRTGVVDMTEQMQLALEALMQVETQIRNVTAKQKELGAFYTSAHPSQQSLDSQRRYLESERTRIEQGIDRLPDTERQLLHYTREVETYRQMYEQTSETLTELRNDAASISSYAAIIDMPEILPGSGLLHYVKIIGIGFFIGCMVGGVVRYTLLFSPLATVRIAGQVAAISDLAVLGRFTRVSSAATLWQGHTLRRMIPLVLGEERNTRTMRECAALMKNLSFASFAAPNPVIMIASTRATQASAAIAANVAIAHARLHRTLLIDCSMRERGIHTQLQYDASPGLSDVMVGRAVLDEAIKPLNENLFFLPGGTPTSYGAPLMHQKLFVDVLSEFGKNFRSIVLYYPGLRADQLNSPLMQYVASIACVIGAGEQLERLRRFLSLLSQRPNAKGVILDDLH